MGGPGPPRGGGPGALPAPGPGAGPRACRKGGPALEVEALAEGLAFRGEDWPKAPLRGEEEVYLGLVRAFRRGGAWGLPLLGVQARALGLVRPALQEGLFQRPGEGLEPLLARFPGALLRVEVVDPGALAPEWGFRLQAWEVEDAASLVSGKGGFGGREAPVGGLSGPAAGGAPPGPLAGGRAVVAP